MKYKKQHNKKREMGTLGSTPQPTLPTVGSTDSCCDAESGSGKDQARSVDFGVTRISETVFQRIEASASIVQLVKSLIYVFVARRSLRPPEKWFSCDKEYGRMIQSFRKLSIELISHENELNEEQDFMKYHLAVLMCKVAGDKQLPPKPDFATRPLFVGWLKRCVQRALANHDLSFIYSLLQSKRFWPQLSEKRMIMALEDHRNNICKKRSETPLPKDLESTILETSYDLFRNLPEPTKLMPSGSACMQAPRRKGGATCLFRAFPDPLRPSVEAEPGKKSDSVVLGRARSLNLSLNNWRQATFEEARSHVLEGIRKGGDSLLDVSVQAIPEPGKFRIITKGDGYLYTMLQPAQGQLLSAWKRSRHSTMRFSSLEELDEAVRTMDENVNEPGWKFMSVDYKSATDLLYKKASDLAILPVRDLLEKAICEFSLMPGMVHYPEEAGVTLADYIGDPSLGGMKYSFKQEEGQLMGHPLSFPLLCSLNLAVYRTSIRRWVDQNPQKRRRLGKLMWRNCLVNGDDMLFKCSDDFIEIFYRTAAEVGFKVSLGKNYVSSHMALINSKLYQRKAGRMERVGYLNLKLILGFSLKSGESASSPDQIGKDLSEMCARCPWAKCTIPLAFSRWSDAWKGWFRPNWFLPVHLGGYGVNPRFASDDLKITSSQRQMSAFFINDPAIQLFRREKNQNLSVFAIPLQQFVGQLANWKVFPSTDLGMPHLEGLKEVDDLWLERLAYASRACQIAVYPSPDGVKFSQIRKRRQSRLKPLSVPGIMKYWDPIVVASGLPDCPPLNVIRGHRTRFLLRQKYRNARNPYR